MSGVLNVTVVPVDSPEEAIGGANVVMCASNTLDPIFFERWIEPGMHLSSIKRPEIETPAIKRADRVVIHTNDARPIHVFTKDLIVPETADGRGWEVAEEVDYDKLPTLPDLIVGRTEGRQSDREVTCFVNNLGLGYQFAAAGSLLYRKAKENGVGHDLPTDWFTEDVHP
jgi:ornithine cyclodeaminase/alanine dehydrogenase-like protein (mu-crystallin family)